MRDTELIGHRGASFDAPENTLAAFRLAWEEGADGVEGDYRLTLDGEIVCLHDPTTRRTAGINLAVAKATLAQLRELDVGSWKGEQWAGEPIPTLREVIATVPPGKRLFIELKSGPEILLPLAAILAESGLPHEQTRRSGSPITGRSGESAAGLPLSKRFSMPWKEPAPAASPAWPTVPSMPRSSRPSAPPGWSSMSGPSTVPAPPLASWNSASIPLPPTGRDGCGRG